LTLPVKRRWFSDEFGLHLAMSRAYARAPRGERAAVAEPVATGSNISVLSALTWHGLRAPMLIDGAIEGEVLELDVKHWLVPELRPGDLVLWDNVPTHKNKRAMARIEATGARVDPLPAYSPDLDPIEECIAKVKTDLRRVKAHTARKLRYALKRALAKVTQHDIRG
jgi:transposase